MTNSEVLQALNITAAIPLGTGAACAGYVPSLILLRSELRAVARALETRRRDLIEDAKAAIDVPDDFDARIGGYIKDPASDPDLAEVITALDEIFVPAWNTFLAEEVELRYPLLSPEQFSALYVQLTAPDTPTTHTVGSSEVNTATLLDMVAERLVAPDNH